MFEQLWPSAKRAALRCSATQTFPGVLAPPTARISRNRRLASQSPFNRLVASRLRSITDPTSRPRLHLNQHRIQEAN